MNVGHGVTAVRDGSAFWQAPAEQTPTVTPGDSARPVIEHALAAYGYSLETACTLIDRLIAEARAE